MQSPSPAQGSTITLSPIERPAFAYLFQLADPLKSGIVTGDDAVKFFEKSGLPRATLGQIWSIADSANNGFLTPPSFSIALRLISHAQKGEQVTEAIAKSPSNPPTFEGITLPLVSQSTGPSTNPLGVMEIKPEDRARYTRIFVNAGPQGGLIDGEKAKEIFVKSKLPFDKLGAIWNLADTQARGSLDLTDFIIGMHFIQNTMNGSLNSIPAVLPAGLYEQAKGGPSSSTFRAFAPPIGHPSSPIAAQTTGGSAGGIQRQFTGPAVSRTFSPPPPLQNVSVFRSPPPPVNPGKNSAWDVTADEKTRSDRFFDGLDTENKGVLEGSAVVPFFMQSKLSESVLAHVWDLSDITQSGTLSRDEFAVAMHLINGQLAGKELPQELPQSLVPPSMRGMNLPEAVNPQQSDTQKDLFSLMDDDTPPLPISAASAFIAPSSTLSRQTVTSPAAAPAAQAPKSSGPFDDDFFGESSSTPQKASFAVTPMLTGGSSSGAGVKSPQVPGTPSLSATQPLNDQSADFGNKSIQLQSTSKAVADLQTKRTGLEAAVTQGAASIAEIETRLATVRSQHESETKLVKDLETRHQTQSDELKKLREDVIREESSLSALKAEKDELEQSVMRDREDIRDLKKRMNEVQQETKMLKESLEKLKKEARQQKGLVAIGKKQLGTAESEREKTKDEIHATQQAIETSRDLPSTVASEAASPRSPEAALSPAASVRSTNPFERLAQGSTSRPESPAVARSSLAEPASSSVPTTKAAVAAGAALGLGGGAVAAAEILKAEESQKDETPSTEVPESSSGFDDAFTVPASSATVATVAGSDFDYNFGDDFAPVTSRDATADLAASTHQPSNSAFDDAFGGLDDSETQGKAVNPTVALPAADDAGANDAFAGEEGFSPSIQPATSHAPGASSTSEAQDDFEGAAATQATTADDDTSADEESSDEEEGPEDIEGTSRHVSPEEKGLEEGADQETAPATDGAQKAAATTVPSAAERFPEVEGPDAIEASSLADDSNPPPTETQGATMPGSLAAFESSPPKESDLPLTENDAVPPQQNAGSTASPAAMSRQMTGATEDPSDAFHDAKSRDDSANSGYGTPGASSAAITAGAFGAGGVVGAVGGSAISNFSRHSADLGHDRYSTAAEQAAPASDGATLDDDDEVPLGALAAVKQSQSQTGDVASPSAPTQSPETNTRSLSPSSSIKTRRAPPPAPVRAATSNATVVSNSTGRGQQGPGASGAGNDESADLSNPFGTDDFAPVTTSTDSNSANVDPLKTSVPEAKTTTSTATSAAPVNTAFDDFDSAFEDLGQPETAPVSGITAAANNNLGFDDAFDNDFDFVPSFADSNKKEDPVSATTSKAAQGGSSQQPFGGFEDFDSAFDTHVAPVTNSAAASTQLVTTSASNESNSNSNTNSGFSFEDAFAPAGPTPQLSLPGDPNTTSPSTGGAQTIYAPPPGPPPGVEPKSTPSSNRPPALPERRNTSSSSAGALPDDAGQVKQLCGMGFSRDAVIKALEKSNYRTERALERLLADA